MNLVTDRPRQAIEQPRWMECLPPEEVEGVGLEGTAADPCKGCGSRRRPASRRRRPRPRGLERRSRRRPRSLSSVPAAVSARRSRSHRPPSGARSSERCARQGVRTPRIVRTFSPTPSRWRSRGGRRSPPRRRARSSEAERPVDHTPTVSQREGGARPARGSRVARSSGSGRRPIDQLAEVPPRMNRVTTYARPGSRQ